MRDFVNLAFPSKSSYESFARATVGAFAARLDPTMEEVADIKTAVSEAVTNAVVHGYRGKEGMIYITCGLEGNVLTVEVKDCGSGIQNIEQARRPMFTTKPEEERSGMGFTIMETFMDKLEVESVPGQGTTVVMKKVLSATRG